MARVNISIGPLSFDHADYDAEGDVLDCTSASLRRARRRRRGMSCATRRIPTVLSA